MSKPAAIEDIFLAAVDKPAVERDAFIESACAGDVEKLRRVRELLAAHVGSLGPLDNRVDVTVEFSSSGDGPGTIIGKYKVVQEIGEGGMGTVYMAQQLEPVKRLVALKITKPGMDSRRVIARFEAERQALALMDHPNIAKVLDAGATPAGRPYFVMELVKGTPITTFCDERMLTLPERLELFRQVCSAVQHAHQKGIIHRDLKPSNILVESHDGRPVPKVIDFGLAKALDQQILTDKTLITGFGTILGTPLYMAPEQAEFSAVDVDKRVDVYALGVLLYELLTGSTPFERSRFAKAAWDEIRRLIKEEEPPRPSARLSTDESLPSVAARRQLEPARLGKFVRGDLDWIAMKALAKERDRRYESATALADDIGRFLRDEPVSAGPPTVGYRLRKFVKRNRSRLAVASLLLVALLGVIVGAIGMTRDRWFQSSVADKQIVQPGDSNPASGKSNDSAIAGPVFPRRMLSISLQSYLYANPLHDGTMLGGRQPGSSSIRRLADRWKVPADQFYLLADADLFAERPSASPPVKSIIEQTVRRFLESSRAQDRVVLLFSGHAVDVEGKAFLVPIEGELNRPETMIPVDWLYEKLAACPAQEKLVIYDVCRLHVERGVARPDAGAMSGNLEKALHEAPAGISVLSSCSRGENSLEVDFVLTDSLELNARGSIFQILLGSSIENEAAANVADDLPIDPLAETIGPRVSEIVRARFPGRSQTPKLSRRRPAVRIAHDASERVPERFAFPVFEPPAEIQVVRSILNEINLPSVKAFREDAPPAALSGILTPRSELIKDYVAGELKANEQPDEFQKAILDAVATIRKLRNPGNKSNLPETFAATRSDQLLQELRKIQEVPALVELALRDHLDSLESLVDQKAAQTKRWQAHYDYVLAELRLRICYVNQYNQAIGNIRTDTVSQLTGDQNGYVLVVDERPLGSTRVEYKQMLKEAKKAFADLITANPGTPWAALAKRDQDLKIGLRLMPATLAR